jgi:16S rRNA (adenine1518-N6/adenine1519-N6)-dimethyltransferase
MIPNKLLGQNFLRDEAVLSDIVRCIKPELNQHIIEIGPGTGALTAKILPLVTSLDVIEIDKNLIPELKKHCHNLGELHIHNFDVLEFDFSKVRIGDELLRIVGNLPYNISTPLFFHLLHAVYYLKDMHFMVQKEVAERLVAEVGSKDYGRLTVMMRYFFDIEMLLIVPPEAFYPKPKVFSAFIRILPHKPKLVANSIEMLEKVVKLAFSQRRKMISNPLKSLISTTELEKLGINPKNRAEDLTVEEFVQISNFVCHKT